jgi:predicted DNA-binding WGR domain protein
MKSNINYRFIGHCCDPSKNEDKVWGVIYLEQLPLYATTLSGWGLHSPTYVNCVTFWGRRGKKLQTCQSLDDFELSKLISNKIKKGYKSVDPTKLHEVYPEFEADLEKTAFWAMLCAP